MQVITLESEVFQKLVTKLTDIENYVKRTTDLFIVSTCTRCLTQQTGGSQRAYPSFSRAVFYPRSG